MQRDFTSDIAFTRAVKTEQERRGSRTGYQKMAEKRDWQSTVTTDLKTFLASRDSCYLGTATRDGQPYIQHRGGPRGFIKPVDDRTLAFADFGGNRQYISLGNLAENDKAYLFLMDYPNRRRVKIWGRARVVEDDRELLNRLADPDYLGRPERAILFEIEAWDVNCPQHIKPRYDEETIALAHKKLIDRIVELQAEIERLRTNPATDKKDSL